MSLSRENINYTVWFVGCYVQIGECNERLLKFVSVPDFVKRKPRDIEDIGHWKGNSMHLKKLGCTSKFGRPSCTSFNSYNLLVCPPPFPNTIILVFMFSLFWCYVDLVKLLCYIWRENSFTLIPTPNSCPLSTCAQFYLSVVLFIQELNCKGGSCGTHCQF